jgi:aminopeptidase N
MIINSDERQWSWMDEGINSFVEYYAEQSWDASFPSRRGPAVKVIDYMKEPKNRTEPIMTNADNIVEFGPNVYTKTATAMNILRKTILGDSLFDFAFREYARRWRFRHPTPADLFRTMEDASGEDLDWFWRGWFYSTDPCDLAIDTVKYFKNDSLAKNFYEIRITNKGGLVMPVIIEWTYDDGTKETDRIPAQIWRYDEQHMAKAFMKDKVVVRVRLDPELETSDIDTTNNTWTKFGRPSKVAFITP